MKGGPVSDRLAEVAREALDQTITHRSPLSGGCIGEVFRLQLENGQQVVAKLDQRADPQLDIEGYMLQYLRAESSLPVPEVIATTPDVLLMHFVPGDSHFVSSSQRHAAQLLAALHGVRGEAHGLPRDTLIGGLHQPNQATPSWVEFFRTQRLLHMAEMARQEGVMGAPLLRRITRFADVLEDFLEEPPYPSLLHGDVWTTNVLASKGQITAFIDPAVYYGHPEVELAFITLFSTFGPPFFDAYNQLRPIRPGFFETRRDIYNLYPLLVHARLFGASYLNSVEGTLSRLGY